MEDTYELRRIISGKSLRIFEEAEFEEAKKNILFHKQSVLKFETALSSAKDAYFNGDYTLGRISHNYFHNCKFDHASLKSVAGAGSIFYNVTFLDTDLSNAFFQSSTLEDCFFQYCQVSANMSQCYIKNTKWYDCTGSTNFTHSHLVNCSFLSSKPGNMGECCLDGVYFENIRLTNMNLEFCHFKNVSFKNVVLPFSQLPYIFGGLEYIFDTQDSIRISSHINEEHSIRVQEYEKVLSDMEVFYSYLEEYFPLANILISQKRYKEALSAILYGIQQSAVQRDFRMCKYYCKLITLNGEFTNDEFKLLYDVLSQAAPVYSLTESQYYQYTKHMPEIRNMLLENPENYPTAILKFETKIQFNESDQIMLILTTFDEILHLDAQHLSSPSISISHNSPLTIVISLCGLPIGILATTYLILNIVSNVCKSYNEVADAIIKTQTITKNYRETQKYDLEKKKLVAEIARLEHENIDLKAKQAMRKQQITQSGLIIASADFVAKDFNPYKYLNT